MATILNQGVGRARWGATAIALAHALTLLHADPAVAETTLGPVQLSGEAVVGAQLVWRDGDKAKLDEYRDVRDRVIGDFDLLLENEEITHWLRGRGENAGYRDQRYWLEGGRYGRYELDLFYGELPHLFSNSARTPYGRSSKSTYDLAPAFVITDPVPAPLWGVDQELQWREGRFGAKYHLGESLLFEGSYRIQDKQGAGNWGLPFGGPGGAGSGFTSLPARIDERIHEARFGVDWLLGDASLSLEYLGNFFQNDFSHVTGQNPNGDPANQVVDPPFGQAATEPDNWAQSLSLAGSASLPIGVPNRISATFAYGFRRQDADFLPHTINTDPIYDIPELQLPASSLDGKVQTLLGNVVATVQPTEAVSAKLRYRMYDFDNLTDSLLFPGDVRNDSGAPRLDPHQSVAQDYRRQNGDLDVAWDFARGWTGVAGFGFEYWHRSDDREVEDLWDYGPSVKLDYRTPGGTLLHAGYQFRNRDGSNYNALAPIEAVVGPGEVCPGNTAKFCRVRKFDEADRYLQNFDLIGQIMPTENLELTLTGNVDYSDYDQTDYGLTKAIGWHVGSDVYYQLHPRVGLLAYYTYEWRRFWQDSRQRTVTEGAEWDSNTQYQYHNGGVTLRLAVLPEKLDADLGYLINYGREKTRAEGGIARNLPLIHDTLQAAYATVNWHFTDRLSLRAGYRWEDYKLKDFREDNVPVTLSDGNNLYLGDTVGDYTANIFAISAVVEF